MFLTKKSFRKILIIAICYFVLGSICLAFAIFFTNMEIDSTFLFTLGVIVYVLNVLIVFCGWYAEGKGKLINLGNKLVRNELKPAEFIKHYEALKNTDTDEIKLVLNGAVAPMIVKPVQGDSFLSIVVPMRLANE